MVSSRVKSRLLRRQAEPRQSRVYFRWGTNPGSTTHTCVTLARGRGSGGSGTGAEHARAGPASAQAAGPGARSCERPAVSATPGGPLSPCRLAPL